MENIISDLNEQQKEAVLINEGPLLVLAGAGTGKTRVLTSKVIQILSLNLAFPSEILAVTFTNKAANEMKERIQSHIPHDISPLWIGTFHSISARILRKHCNLVGLGQDFTIIGGDDQNRLLKQILKELGIDTKQFLPRQYAYKINFWKDKGLNPSDIINESISDNSVPQIKEIYSIYQTRLKNTNIVDFGDLLLHVLNILKKNENIANIYHNKFKYLLVDEYQDTNNAQYLWLKQIAGHHKKQNINICCVGDDDQSIYSWRGAEIKNILKFENDYKNAKIVRLEKNYRSTKHILNVASILINNNTGRHKKTLWTDSEKNVEKVRLISFHNDREESNFICNEVQNFLITNNPIQYNDIAILVRAGYQTRTFEEAFLKTGIPYKVIGGLRFYERKEIQNAVSYLRIIYNENDNLAFERIINVPKRGIGTTTVGTILQAANLYETSLIKTSVKLCEENKIKGKTKESLLNLIKKISKWKNLLNNGIECSKLMEIVLDESEYLLSLKNETTLESQGRLENLAEFVRSLDDFTTVGEFLEYVSLVSDKGDEEKTEKNPVNIMTIHSAKGLEFNTVFLPGWEEGIFPSPKSIEIKNGIEEERRLAYVAITRAKENLYISHTYSRYEFGRIQEMLPSRFISELPKEDLVKINSGLNFYKKNNDDKEVFDYINKINNNSLYLKGSKKYKNIKLGKKKFGGYANQKTMEFFMKSSKKNDKFEIGEKINHPKFGEGKVLSQRDDKLTISFKEFGIKNILSSFVKKHSVT
ncbi:ATP-dependent helicase [Pseudomonadota bacterium]